MARTPSGFSCAATCEGEVRHTTSVTHTNSGKSDRHNHLRLSKSASLETCQRGGQLTVLNKSTHHRRQFRPPVFYGPRRLRSIVGHIEQRRACTHADMIRADVRVSTDIRTIAQACAFPSPFLSILRAIGMSVN